MLRAKPLTLDSNLLLLLTVGTFEPRTLINFKRLSSFSISDLRVLQDLASTRTLMATPHSLTEVSNLASSLPEILRLGFLNYFATFVSRISEHFVQADTLSRDRSFRLFGLTDAAMCELASTSDVVTEDARLRAYMQHRGLSVLGLKDLLLSDKKPLMRERKQS
jgi:hypothetical protein